MYNREIVYLLHRAAQFLNHHKLDELGFAASPSLCAKQLVYLANILSSVDLRSCVTHSMEEFEGHCCTPTNDL